MIRIATIGTNTITSVFIDAISQTPGATFIGACSRDAERAAKFTAEHGGAYSFASVEEMASHPEVDAVYVASPNALHHDHALTCIAGGKHVFVEKSFCANQREAREVFDAADAAGVVAFDGMRPLHDPAFYAIRDTLPQLGTIRRATIRFGKYSTRYEDILAKRHSNVFDCNLATGSLMDIGIYSVEPLITLFGAPTSVKAAGALLDESLYDLTNGPIDCAGIILATYPNMVASTHHAKNVNDLAESQIEGELGTLTIDAIANPEHVRLDMRVQNPSLGSLGYSVAQTVTSELELPAQPANLMLHEVEDFTAACEAVAAGTKPAEAPAGPFGTVGSFRAITLASLAVMDEARRQMGVTFPADKQ